MTRIALAFAALLANALPAAADPPATPLVCVTNQTSFNLRAKWEHMSAGAWTFLQEPSLAGGGQSCRRVPNATRSRVTISVSSGSSWRQACQNEFPAGRTARVVVTGTAQNAACRVE